MTIARPIEWHFKLFLFIFHFSLQLIFLSNRQLDGGACNKLVYEMSRSRSSIVLLRTTSVRITLSISFLFYYFHLFFLFSLTLLIDFVTKKRYINWVLNNTALELFFPRLSFHTSLQTIANMRSMNVGNSQPSFVAVHRVLSLLSICCCSVSLSARCYRCSTIIFFLPMLESDYYSLCHEIKTVELHERSQLFFLLSAHSLSLALVEYFFLLFFSPKIFRIFSSTSLLDYTTVGGCIKCFRQVNLVLVAEALLKANLSSWRAGASEWIEKINCSSRTSVVLHIILSVWK